MAVLSKVLLQLRQERKRAYSELMRLDGAIAALMKLTSRDGARGVSRVAGRRPRRKMSAAGRMRIAAAQKARWAKIKAQQKKKAA